MRESSLDLTKAIVAGVLPITGANLVGLLSCKNARPYGVGMEYIAPYESYLDLTGVYPFPQLLVSDKFQYVATATAIYEIVAGELILKATQNATTHYDIADFKDSVAIVGNGKTLFRSSTGLLVPLTHVPEASTACSYKGLLLLGNISSWTQLLDADSSTLTWAARPLSSEFRLADMNVPTGAGYIRLFCGTILRIFYKGDAIVVFGTKGIVVLGLVSEPVPTLNVVSELPVTISQREAIVQSDEGFSFIDAFGFAFAFALREAQLKRLGFKHLFFGKRVVGVYDCQEKETLLCNGETTLAIGEYGAGQRDQVITSGGLVGSAFKAAVTETFSEDFELIVAPQNMGVAGIKTIYASGVDYETDGSISVHDSPVNSIGVAPKIIAADSFAPKINITGLTHAKVNSLDLRWKLTDKRNVRGQYASQTTA
jgi:hypothetical protein